MMPKKSGSIGQNHHGFPRLEVIIIAFCVAVNWYTLANLIPYVGIMATQLLGLESINEAGEVSATGAALECHKMRKGDE